MGRTLGKTIMGYLGKEIFFLCTALLHLFLIAFMARTRKLAAEQYKGIWGDENRKTSGHY